MNFSVPLLFNPVIENELYHFHEQQNDQQLVPIHIPFPIPIAIQQPRPMPIRQWIAKFLAKHFKHHLPLAQQIAQRIPIAQHIVQKILPQIQAQFPSVEYPLEIPNEYLLPEFPLDYSSPIYQSYPQSILPYLAPNAMEENAMNETEKKKFKFWRPFSGIRDRFRKFFFGNKKGNETQTANQNQIQGI